MPLRYRREADVGSCPPAADTSAGAVPSVKHLIAAVDPVAVFGGADADDVMAADVGDDPPELAVGVIDGEPFAELRAGIFGAVGSPGLLADRPAFLRKILLDCGLINARGFPPYDVQLVKDLIPAFAGSAGDGAYNAVIGDMTFPSGVAPAWWGSGHSVYS